MKAEGNIWARTALRETPEPARDFQFLPRSHFASCPAAATSKQPHNPEHLTTQTIAIQAQVCHQTPIPPPASDSLVRLTSSTPPPSPSAPVKLTSPQRACPALSPSSGENINNSLATTLSHRKLPIAPLSAPRTLTRRAVAAAKACTSQPPELPDTSGTNGGYNTFGKTDSAR